MSSTPSPASRPQNRTLKVVSHSMLFYWWPIWVVGFGLALLTYLEGTRLAVVPEGTRVQASQEGSLHTYSLSFASEPPASLREAAVARAGQEPFPTRMSDSRDYGIVYVLLLLLVIFITNVPMRGLWSVFVLMLLLLLIVLFAALHWWGPILSAIGSLHISISAEGYLVSSAVLFLLWVAVVLVYDQRRYITFTAGQIVVHQEVGDAEQVFDTTNVTVQKRRSDLFRHWLLGFGSGDLVVQMPGTSGAMILLPNVLFAARRVQDIADLMKTRPVVNE